MHEYRLNGLESIASSTSLNRKNSTQVVAIRDIIPPPVRETFNDVYIAYELVDTDLHQIIHFNQALSEEHCQNVAIPLSGGAVATSSGPMDRASPAVTITGMNGDARNLVDVKPRITEELTDRSKSWKLTEINEPTHCRSLRLMDNMRTSKCAIGAVKAFKIGAFRHSGS